MCAIIREWVVKKTDIQLSGVVEADEFGPTMRLCCGRTKRAAPKKNALRNPCRRRLKSKRGRGKAADEKYPIFGIVERIGLARLQVLPNVQQKTIEPIIKKIVSVGSIFYTDEYNIYNNIGSLGYEHKTANHGEVEYARDEDGFYEVQGNTQEGILSLLKSWLRPHRGVS